MRSSVPVDLSTDWEFLLSFSSCESLLMGWSALVLFSIAVAVTVDSDAGSACEVPTDLSACDEYTDESLLPPYW